MSKKSQERYRAAGLCIFCGQLPPRAGVQSCGPCGARQAANSRRRKQRQMEEKRCVRCGGQPLVTKQHCEPCRERHQEATRRRYALIRDEVFRAYGGYVCACCGETEPAFLTIDHIYGGGDTHRKEVGQSNIYRWLRDNNYPDGFQVLCMNCQFGRKLLGVCPHQTDREDVPPGKPQVTRLPAHQQE